MVIDVGAGTSDFSLYRMGFDPAKDISVAYEVSGSATGITEAGNYLDALLKGLILQKAGIDSNHPHWVNIMGALELNLRNYKEALFRDEIVSVSLFNGDVVDVALADFLSLSQVQLFSDSLKNCMVNILKKVDSSFIKGAPNNTLGVALTGGGSDLPMVKALAQGELNINGVEIKLHQTPRFPSWLEEDYPDLEMDYPRISVSLGGARKRIIKRDVATITAGGIGPPGSLVGFYVQGI
jgi:molecular chaperone HscA